MVLKCIVQKKTWHHYNPKDPPFDMKHQLMSADSLPVVKIDLSRKVNFHYFFFHFYTIWEFFPKPFFLLVWAWTSNFSSFMMHHSCPELSVRLKKWPRYMTITRSFCIGQRSKWALNQNFLTSHFCLNPICQFCQFFIVSSKLLKLKKSDSQNPRKWLSCVIKLEILDFQAQTNRKKGFANNS